ncbi:MAG: metallophosphoesterase [Candidatus Methylarchaceae archaeon HK02M2]|nr:metallophosphoesterase [Candidatus Methylarchaceae archaeon HK02M2]
MKLLAIADVHGNSRVIQWLIELGRYADLLIVAGDVSDWGNELFFKNFFEIISEKGLKTFFVPGNHDPNNELNLRNILNLHNNVINYYNMIFCGIGGSNLTPFNTPFELDDFRAEEVFSRLPDKVDVFVSHASPYKTRCDRSYKGEHIGSKPLRRYIEKTQPKIVICGHIHEARSTDMLENTLVVNPGPAMNGFYVTISLNGKPKVDLLQAE